MAGTTVTPKETSIGSTGIVGLGTTVVTTAWKARNTTTATHKQIVRATTRIRILTRIRSSDTAEGYFELREHEKEVTRFTGQIVLCLAIHVS
jgi:hypothetical protein